MAFTNSSSQISAHDFGRFRHGKNLRAGMRGRSPAWWIPIYETLDVIWTPAPELAAAMTPSRPACVSVNGGGCRPFASVRGARGAHGLPYGSTPSSKPRCSSRLIDLATGFAMREGTMVSLERAAENCLVVKLAKAVTARRAAVGASLIVPVYDRVAVRERARLINSWCGGGVDTIDQLDITQRDVF